MVFPATQLGTTVELYLGATLGWVNITPDVRLESATSGGGVSISRGRPNEGRDTEVTRCNLVLNNAGGKYSPRNPASPYYGLLGRNTPIRVRLADVGQGGALAVDGWRRNGGSPGAAVTAPHSSLDITGDLDVRVWLRMPVWSGQGGVFIAGKTDSWSMAISDTGAVQLFWVETGGTLRGTSSGSSFPAVPAADGSLALRSTFAPSTGTFTWYTAPTIAGPWTLLRTFALGATSLRAASTYGVQVGRSDSFGDNAASGEVYGFELRSGGTLVASPDFTTLRAGHTSLTDAQGRVWTFTDGAVPIDRGARFQGEVSSWPQRWNLAGTDQWVSLEAAGITRRLSQGTSPIRSALYRTLSATNPAAYLPLEDGTESTRPTSAAVGVSAGSSSKVKFGVEAGRLAGTESAAQMSDATSTISTSVQRRATATQWSLLVFFKLKQMPVGTDVTYLRAYFTGGRVVRWEFQLSGGGYRWIGYDNLGNVVDDQSFTNVDHPPNDWLLMYVEWTKSGTNVSWQPWVTNAGDTGFSIAGPFTYSGAVGTPTRVEMVGSAYFTEALVSHLVVDDQRLLFADDFGRVSTGYLGEPAGERMARLAAEEGLPLTWWGFPHDTEPMGPQPVAPLIDLLRDAAKTDGGILLEGRGHLGLHYRTRASLYNQPAIALDYTDLAPPFEPVDDDDATRNDVEVKRTDGGSARAVQSTGPLSVLDPPAGVGVYDTSETVNVATDEQLDDQAGWRLHLGTVDEARYPRIRFNLANPALVGDQATTKAVALADAGDVASIGGLPAWLPPGPARVMVQGYTETLDAHEWTITWNGAPASPWDVGTVDGAARVAADGTTLTAGITTGALSVQITSTSANGAWTTDPADFPLDLRIGAERVTATAISGAGLTQTVTLSARAVNGVSKAWTAGTEVDVWQPAVSAL